MRRASHRVRQFFGALQPRVTADERARAYTYLNEGQRRIFESMTLRDQQHGIVVCRRVEAGGGDAALMTAALLHDCGKGRVTLWQRVGHVVLGALAPGLRTRVGREHGAAWRQAFWRLLHHPEIGASMIAETGADADVVRMIREQDAVSADGRLALLQAADEA